jgi:hypothetical protein
MNRRNFIRQSLATGTALGAVGMFPSYGFQSSPIKVGIIGLDTSHAPAFHKDLQCG